MSLPRSASVLAILALVLVLAGALAAPIAAQPANNSTSANGTNATDAPVGEGTVVSCQQIRENPQGDPNAPYRIVEGACAIELTDGDVLSRVWFKASGERIDVWARGKGWTIRNVAITNHGASGNPPLNLRVGSRNGSGLVSNLWVSDSKSNGVFIHPKHSGEIVFRRATFLRLGEDATYASRPGNPVNSPVGGIDGRSGIVGFEQTYVKNVGTGPKSGYGLRLGSDGSYVINSTIVSSSGPAVANTFAGGQHRNMHPNAFEGVLLRNVDIVTENVGLRVNNHQSGAKSQRRWTSVTTLQNVDIEAGQPIQRNEAGGEEPVIRGEYGSNADPSPPPGAPRSPVRAASGVGGGTGSIGGPVSGPGGGVFDFDGIAKAVATGATGLLIGIFGLIPGLFALAVLVVLFCLAVVWFGGFLRRLLPF